MRARAPSLRPLGWGLALALLLVVVVALVPGESGQPSEPAGPPRVAPGEGADRTSEMVGLVVLRRWDRQRAAAWRGGDLRALERLYAPGSAVGRTDRAMLAAYVRRGLRVRGLRMQVAEARVESSSADRLVVRVTDRVASTAVAVGRGRELALPLDRWSSRRVELVRTGQGWRVARVAPAAALSEGRQSPERPAESTASTSGSENS